MHLTFKKSITGCGAPSLDPSAMRPVEASAGEQPYRTAIQARMHAVAVEFDFMQPLVAFGRRIDQLRELRRDPLG